MSLVLHDGDCAFCQRSVRFVLARDPHARYRFAPLRSGPGERLLREHGIPEDEDTMALVEDDGRAFVRSTAALRVARGMRWPWSWLGSLGLLVPCPLRDAAYRAVARRRHRLASDACPAPSPELRARILPWQGSRRRSRP